MVELQLLILAGTKAEFDGPHDSGKVTIGGVALTSENTIAEIQAIDDITSGVITYTTIADTFAKIVEANTNDGVEALLLLVLLNSQNYMQQQQ